MRNEGTSNYQAIVLAVKTAAHSALLPGSGGCRFKGFVCVCYVQQRTELKWSSAQLSKTKQVLPELLQPSKKIKTMQGFQRASLDQQTHNPLSPHYNIFKDQTTVLRNNKNFTPPITSHTFPESTKQETQSYMITQDDMYITISVNKEENVLQKAGIKYYYSYYYT